MDVVVAATAIISTMRVTTSSAIRILQQPQLSIYAGGGGGGGGNVTSGSGHG